MNKRQRKKWLKKQGLYVAPQETWELYGGIADFLIPRLKAFKKETNAYPGRGDATTFEDWMVLLDKMILAFEYARDDDWVDGAAYNFGKYLTYNDKTHNMDINEGCEEIYKQTKDNYVQEANRRQEVITEGLNLFAKYYQDLWW